MSISLFFPSPTVGVKMHKRMVPSGRVLSVVEVTLALGCDMFSMSPKVSDLDDVVVMIVGKCSRLLFTVGPTPCRSIEVICL